MSRSPKLTGCPDCEGVSRREFLKGSLAVAAAVAAPGLSVPRPAAAADHPAAPLVAELYPTLSEAQKRAVCFPWEHPRRLAIGNNWHIVPQTIGEFFNRDQQALILEIFKAAHSQEWVDQRLKQLKDDAGGFEHYNMAIFGNPVGDRFTWVFTGRHLTLRVDNDSDPGVAFGGPIFYGHAAQGFNEKPDHPGNVYWYQALRANQVYQMLDGKQRRQALVTGPVPPEEPGTLLPREPARRPGMPVAEMSRDQRELVARVLDDLLAPMHPLDRREAEQFLQANGGAGSLHMAFYQQEDIGEDGVWDVWRLEGPNMVWYFRGSPHVHTWVMLTDGKRTIRPVNP